MFQYRDVNGNLSRQFYWAGAYVCGRAIVQEKEDSYYQILNEEGKLSEQTFQDLELAGVALRTPNQITFSEDENGEIEL